MYVNTSNTHKHTYAQKKNDYAKSTKWQTMLDDDATAAATNRCCNFLVTIFLCLSI